MINTKSFSLIALATVSLFGLNTPALASGLRFGTDGMQFSEDTIVNFTFLESRGHAVSRLDLYEMGPNSLPRLVAPLFAERDISDPQYNNTNPAQVEGGLKNQWLGTARNLQGSPTVSVKLLANQIYSLGLTGVDWGQQMVTTYSTSSWNAGNVQFGAFNTVGGSEGRNYDMFAQHETSGLNRLNAGVPVAIAMNDLTTGVNGVSYWQDDRDFNDFVIQAEVPEPLTMTGLALGIGGILAARRRQVKNG